MINSLGFAPAGVSLLQRATVVGLGCFHKTSLASASAGGLPELALFAVPAAVLLLAVACLLILKRHCYRRLREMSRLAVEHSAAAGERNHLFSETSDLVYIGDLSGNPIQLNPVWMRMFGHEPDSLTRQGSVESFIPTPDVEQVQAHVRGLIADGQPRRWNGRVRTVSGDIRWIAWTLKLLPEASRFLAIGHDITEFHDTADESAQRNADLFDALAAARSAMEEKSRFLATTGHEIRTPLHGILGMTELLLTTRLTPEQRGYAQTVRDSSESLMGLLNDLLEYSRIEARGIEIHNAPYNPRDLVHAVVQLMTPKAAEKGLRIESEFAPGLSGLAAGDSGRVRQVLTNLVSNAVRFTDRGSIRIVAAPGAAPGWLLMKVIDTGIGIAQGDQDRIFDPFLQLPGAHRKGGSGLGLSISKQLVEAMGGKISVESTRNAGSTFWFEIPLAARRSGSDGDGEAARRRVLVVEDNLVNQTLTRRLLEKNGYRVDVCENGVEALAATSNTNYDLILMDLQMPEMDGLTATEAIRGCEEAGPRRTPIVALTASVMPNDVERCRAAGMDDYLSKPFTPEALRAKVERWTRQHEPAISGV
ncbi:MAG: response regulator [Bryobacteraceae bacterium]